MFGSRFLHVLIVIAFSSLVVIGCGGGDKKSTGDSSTTEKPTSTSKGTGNATAGKALFASEGCSGCHTLSAAGATGTTGPNLDKTLKGKPASFVEQSITDPDKVIAKGFSAGIMPKDYEKDLSKTQLDDLVAFIESSVNK